MAAILGGCGGASNEPSRVPSSESGRSLPRAEEPRRADERPRDSVVAFDDLGVSFVVPSGFRAVGDDEIARRVRASSSPKLQDVLKERIAQRRSLPLLTLTKSPAGPADSLDFSLGIVAVPDDTKPEELLEHERAVMKEHLESFEASGAPRTLSLDGVPGAELEAQYETRGARNARRLASTMRVYVRGGLAFLATSVWAHDSPTGSAEARVLLEGLRFYEPKP